MQMGQYTTSKKQTKQMAAEKYWYMRKNLGRNDSKYTDWYPKKILKKHRLERSINIQNLIVYN